MAGLFGGKFIMKISFINEKGVKNTNEDSYLIKDNIWGVFDGANSLNKYVDKDGKTGGLIASMITRDAFEKNDKSLRDMAMDANLRINEELNKRKIDSSDKLNLWCTNLAVVKIDGDKIHWIQLSDATIVFVYSNNSYKLILDNNEYDNETLLKCKELARDKAKNMRELIDEQIKSVRKKINVTYGFLTGEKEAISFIKEGEENIKDIKHILLFTDGFTIPQKDPLDPYSWDNFVKQYLRDGIEGLRDKIRTIEKSDPNCWLYPRMKKHDDMTAISITL
ncbi:MAG: protein phosphatase 2C domain-containing protein [Leadbetterella sp.]|nr:protein phosphatase 2C domain-containing protein [Leadbetterella sp.]